MTKQLTPAEELRVEVGGLECPYCNEISKTIEAATAHDAECPNHPAVIRAEKAEDYAEKLIYAVTDGNMSKTYDVQVVADEVSRIWQAYTDEKVAKARAEAEANVARLTKERDWLATQLACIQSAYDIDQKTRDWSTARWAEAARKAVAGEGK